MKARWFYQGLAYQPHVLAGSGGRRQSGRRSPGPPKPYGSYPWYSTWLVDQGPFQLKNEQGQWLEMEGPAAILLPPYSGDRIILPVSTLFSWVEWGVLATERVERVGGGAWKYPGDEEQPSPEEIWGEPLPLLLSEVQLAATRRMMFRVNGLWWRSDWHRLQGDAELALWIAGLMLPKGIQQAVSDIFPEASSAFVKQIELLDQLLDSGMNIQGWAGALELNARTLSRRCHAETGLSPSQVLEQLRSVRAQEYLRDPDQRISSVARRCGFETREAFSAWFRRRFSEPPARWRQQQ